MSAGRLELKLSPTDPQQGQIAMCRPVTAEQWQAIRGILYTRPSAIDTVEDYSDLLRELCCFLSVGGYNSQGLMSVATARAKIYDGIDDIVKVERNRVKTEGCAGFQGLPVATCGVCEGKGCDAAIDDHKIADTVNALRDIAVEFHDAQQLRERIAHVIVPVLKAEKNFCSRCGKPTPPESIHTCTPPTGAGKDAGEQIEVLQLSLMAAALRASILRNALENIANYRTDVDSQIAARSMRFYAEIALADFATNVVAKEPQ